MSPIAEPGGEPGLPYHGSGRPCHTPTTLELFPWPPGKEPAELADEEVLARLLALNGERAGQAARASGARKARKKRGIRERVTGEQGCSSGRRTPTGDRLTAYHNRAMITPMGDSSPQPSWQVEFFTTASGRSPVLDFINSLPTRERGEVRNSLRLLREFGTRLGFPDARHLQGKLWELRPGHHRLLYFAQVGHRFVILHAFRKQSGSTPRQDLDLALRRMSELA